MHIKALQEIRWKGAGRIDKLKFTFLYSTGNTQKKSEKEVGFILNETIKKSVIKFDPVNDREYVNNE